jgi:hypothetical protein
VRGAGNSRNTVLEESCPEGGPFVMSDSRENFDAWFVNVLESLYPRREAGFVILMIAFPLLERYLRQRVGLPAEDDRLTTNFMMNFVNSSRNYVTQTKRGLFGRSTGMVCFIREHFLRKE